MKYCFLIVIFALPSIVLAQNTILNTEKIIQTHFCDSTELAFVNLHDDENTSMEAGLQLFDKGKIIELRHTGKRLLSFSVQKRLYQVDPNRIFTNRGIYLSMKQHSHFDSIGFRVVVQFRDSILKQITPSFIIVALHNNKNGYSIRSYQKGGIYSKDAELVATNSNISPRNFFLVTQFSHFLILRSLKQNVVLQSKDAKDDGSLSIWAQRSKIAYINVEAADGHLKEQQMMLAVLNCHILHNRFFETMRLLDYLSKESNVIIDDI